MAMHSIFSYVPYFLPAVMVLAAVEAVVLSLVRKGAYNWRGALASVVDALGREHVVYAYLPFGLALPLAGFAWNHRLTTVPLSGWAAFTVLFIGVEFCYYWFHRASHRVRWFWATHAVHHSTNELNLSAAYRFGWTGRLAGASVFYIPLFWFGFPPAAVFGVLSLNLLYQFWLHTEWIPKLGWLEHVFNTPSHHRVHHAANLDYLDANYGGVLIVFDRLFGTLIEERADLPCRYGLVKPLLSNNPFVINFYEWRALARDVWQARSWRERIFYIFGPPGWRPDGKGLTTQDLRREASLAVAAE
jgi:sterol desaturase/sphingolipid hydroxylase (fatty acid hydroxylase superfamily)